MKASTFTSTHRLEALSDGIYGVALTLLALDLKLPPLAAETASELGAALAAILDKGLVWILSFWVGTLFWLVQGRVLRQYARLDGSGLLIELTQLALVTLLPFSTALIGEHGDLIAAAAIYSTHLTLLASLSALRIWRLAHRAELRSPEFDPDAVAWQLGKAWIVLSCALVAVVLAPFVPGWNMLAMLGVLLRAPIAKIRRGTRDEHAPGER